MIKKSKAKIKITKIIKAIIRGSKSRRSCNKEAVVIEALWGM